ncbi:Metallo-dependent phosphatase-like protein [Desarmillaria tabescens]|uniref:Sphingomyelin phosphodiesterase n=1 Tax=Armillaria tabescens TaxID=1929756 RepID=A0AA39NHB5_ARMTA|nr:Metallo-dependent phosphatase-like protein [Desarmillaria tabescens]KAK0465473.1 Metallo-dependent phosphatase-like protein [Desarmillaria tabescens]
MPGSLVLRLSLLAIISKAFAGALEQTTAIYTAPGAFPTSLYSEYYNNPTATSAQVQPVISDAVTTPTHCHPPRYPLDYTLRLSPKSSQFPRIPSFGDNTCARCQAGLEIAKFLALAAPEEGPALAVELCEAFDFTTSCSATYNILGLGSVITQVIANADVGGYDGQMLCSNFLGLCELPPTSALNLTNWFAKPKPNPLPTPKQPSGERLKVLHISDLHLDPRYATGSEANCTSGLCCRADNSNAVSPETPLFPAPRYGAFKCDSPFALVLAALEAIPVLTETEETGFAFSLYTGDLVSHDKDNQLSRDYTKWTEATVYDLFKRMLGNGAVYPALGNHDSYNQAQDAPHAIGQGLAQQFSWRVSYSDVLPVPFLTYYSLRNYDHVAGLWEHEGWLSSEAANLSRAHYSAYMVNRQDGLRIISLNTDLWYKANYFNYINLTDPDVSGMLRFLTDELQDAEDAGDRVWIIGHVLSGWDGSNPLENPTNLFYQIVDRFTPHVIANIFFGHTHEDQVSIFYANNATDASAETAGTIAWIGPSLTPITNLNSGFRMYEVDSATFDIVDAHTWRSDVSQFTALDNQTNEGPTYLYEYSTRAVYGANITWGQTDPLNATWWHLVTEAMEADSSLVTTFHTLQGKTSIKTGSCDEACIAATICYIRSGSASIAKENCELGYGSVQS